MNVLRDLRYKLQKRIQRLQTVAADGFSLELVRFFDFFDSNRTLRDCAASLNAMYPNMEDELKTALQQFHGLLGLTEAENAAIGLTLLRKVAVANGPRMPFMNYVEPGSISDMLDRFRERYLEPFYEYIDEQLEDRNVVLAELIRFKHVAEWFRREQLWDRWISDAGSGERRLAFAVYEFLYEQGIDFHIEPASASGEADMVSAQHSSTPLVADVKIFDPVSGRGSAYIKRGFQQVCHYLRDFNQPIGYLIVFKGTEKELEIQASTVMGEAVPFLTIGDKTVFVVQIDIFPHEKTASKRPIPEREVISEAELRSEAESN